MQDPYQHLRWISLQEELIFGSFYLLNIVSRSPRWMQQGLEYAYNQITIATLHQNHFSTDLLQNDKIFFSFLLYILKKVLTYLSLLA